NVFVDGGDSTWTVVADDRESTFGLDVDTGSFTVGRRFLDEGHLPEPESIRVEEWLNAFDYTMHPTGGGPLGVVVETVDAPRADDGTQLVRVAVSTDELAAADRPAAHLTFVIDTSGSMDIRQRLGLVQSSLALLVNELNPDDTIAIVTYGDDAVPVLAPTPVSEADTIIDAIDDLGPGGSTNMEAGLMLGYEQAREAYRADAINVVVLASDGVANVGVTDADVLTEQITQAGEQGIHLVTVGYGMGNYNDHLMEQLADQGDGFYSYVDTFEEAERLFVEDLTPTLTVVAEEAKVQVVFDDEVVEAYRLIGYENRQLDDGDFRDDTVDAGELGAGHHVTALYEVRLSADGPSERIPSPDGPPLGEVRLRWTSPETGEATEIDAVIPPNAATPSTDIRLAALVADLAELLKGNEVVDERGVTLAQLHDDAELLADEDVDGADELVELIEQAQSID
ncbi:MAG: von Willebrand factor type A domain-containing protein, partial [Desertimonas sp.]